MLPVYYADLPATLQDSNRGQSLYKLYIETDKSTDRRSDATKNM